VGIEYEGELMSEPDGIKATKKLLEAIKKGKPVVDKTKSRRTASE
jgi:hypothetical protein